MSTYYGELLNYQIDNEKTLKQNFDDYIHELNRERYANEGSCTSTIDL